MRQLKITHQITNRDSATLEKYFTEIAREELLTPEQEVDLARRIKQGDIRALEKLVRANLRFVVSVAKQYHHGSMPLNDLINEGNLGLIKAARMFDETKGFKFISYAVWWIRQAIMEALNEHSRLVRVPANKIGELSKINQALGAMEQRLEREATQDELAEYLGIKPEDIKSANTANVRQSSLDAPFEAGEDGSLYDVIKNPDADPADSMVVEKDSLKIELNRLLSTLNEREQAVLRRFFGIGFDYSLSLDDIAEDLNLTRERVRQIKELALNKLRANPIAMKLLQPYIG